MAIGRRNGIDGMLFDAPRSIGNDRGIEAGVQAGIVAQSGTHPSAVLRNKGQHIGEATRPG